MIREIFNMNCFELFKMIKEGGLKVDAIITDPPYNISRPNNFNTIGRAGIDFGKWDMDLVLDPFMGSGTTALACQELGRDYIGSEIDKNYWEKANKRLAKARQLKNKL